MGRRAFNFLPMILLFYSGNNITNFSHIHFKHNPFPLMYIYIKNSAFIFKLTTNKNFVLHICNQCCLISGSIVHETDANAPRKLEKKLEESSSSISTKQKDVTTPMTTTTTTSPMLNPTRSGSESPTITSSSTPTARGRGSSAGSWCVATQSAPHAALQVRYLSNIIIFILIIHLISFFFIYMICIKACIYLQPGYF